MGLVFGVPRGRLECPGGSGRSGSTALSGPRLLEIVEVTSSLVAYLLLDDVGNILCVSLPDLSGLQQYSVVFGKILAFETLYHQPTVIWVLRGTDFYTLVRPVSCRDTWMLGIVRQYRLDGV